MREPGGQQAVTIVVVVGLLGLGGCASGGRAASGPQALPAEPGEAIRGCHGTYDAAPRRADGHVDGAKLLNDLRDLRADTYNWLIAHAPTDWEDLQTFLPAARQQGVLVWVTLLPPSESPPHTRHFSEPFRLDYERWAEEIARLSVREPNLVAWSIDDFVHNLSVYTPDRTREMVRQAHEINPRLAFVPCCYFRQSTEAFARDYRGLFDGVLFPYRNESRGANLTDAAAVQDEVRQLRERMGPGMPIIVDVYATRHSRLGDSTPEYVRQVMTAAESCADGVLVYCHQDRQKQAAKYEVVKQVFHGRPESGSR